MPKSRWNDKHIITAYELAKSGLNLTKTAKAMGLATATFRTWMDKKPIFRYAFRKGRRVYKGKNKKGFTFQDYVYKRLSKKLRKLWKEIKKVDDTNSGVEKIEALLEKGGVRARQNLFIHAWTVSNFSISNALRKVNISRFTFNAWKSKDPDFAKLVAEIEWHKKNFFEDHLSMLIAGGDPSATIFANKTYNRDRGYNEKIEVDMHMAGNINHSVISVGDLGLSLKVRKEILKGFRKQQVLLNSPA